LVAIPSTVADTDHEFLTGRDTYTLLGGVERDAHSRGSPASRPHPAAARRPQRPPAVRHRTLGARRDRAEPGDLPRDHRHLRLRVADGTNAARRIRQRAPAEERAPLTRATSATSAQGVLA